MDNAATPPHDPTSQTDIASQAADPGTALETLASIAATYPVARAAVVANPSAYPGLLEWIATDAATPADALAALAASHHELHPAIAAHPNAYDGLRDWIAQVAPAAATPVAAPVFGAPAAAPAYGAPATAAPARTGGLFGSFVEPTRSIPLAWSTYRTRMILAYSLAAFAGIVLQTIGIFVSGSTAAFVVLDVLAALTVFAMFFALPGQLSRRLIAGGSAAALIIIFSLVSLFVLYNFFVPSLGVVAIVAGWFFVRQRSGLTYVFVALALVLFLLQSLAASAFASTVFQFGTSIELSIMMINFGYAYIPAIAVAVPIALGRLLATFRPARQSVLS